jgi:L-fuconolactonase
MTRQKWPVEAIIQPELPIVDPHHHLWFIPDAIFLELQKADNYFARAITPVLRRNARYLFEDLMADLNSGHNIRATVYVENGWAMYRAKGPDAMKSVGEVEFANGVAAMAASEVFGDVKACAGIVGHADLRLGDSVEDVLRAHIRAGGARYRGIRQTTAYDPEIMGPGEAHVLLDKKFRTGFKWLHKLGLSFDAWMLDPQLSELIDLARAFPETQIILDHVGTPVGVSKYEGARDERFSTWRDNIRTLSKSGNVVVKLGGFGSSLSGFKSFNSTPPFDSEQLAAEWKPYVETCIEAFGADRCMFESDFPVSSGTCTYPVLWNAFKRLAAGASKDEQTALFSGTASRVYRLDV